MRSQKEDWLDKFIGGFWKTKQLIVQCVSVYIRCTMFVFVLSNIVYFRCFIVILSLYIQIKTFSNFLQIYIIQIYTKLHWVGAAEVDSYRNYWLADCVYIYIINNLIIPIVLFLHPIYYIICSEIKMLFCIEQLLCFRFIF